MEIPKEGFIRKHLKHCYIPYADPRCLLVYSRPDQYKIIGLPKNKDYDGDDIRKLYYIGIRKGKMVFHTKRRIAWKRSTTLAKLRKKIGDMFGAIATYIETDTAFLASNR